MTGKDLIVLYIDSDSPTPDDVPSISVPYRDMDAFKKNNHDLKALSGYSKNHLLEKWGVLSEIKKLKEVNALLTESNDFYRKMENYRVYKNVKGITQYVTRLPAEDCSRHSDMGFQLVLGGKLARETNVKIKEIMERK